MSKVLPLKPNKSFPYRVFTRAILWGFKENFMPVECIFDVALTCLGEDIIKEDITSSLFSFGSMIFSLAKVYRWSYDSCYWLVEVLYPIITPLLCSNIKSVFVSRLRDIGETKFDPIGEVKTEWRYATDLVAS